MSDAIEAARQAYLRSCGAYMTERECPECEFAIQHQLGPAIAAYRDSEIEALRGQVSELRTALHSVLRTNEQNIVAANRHFETEAKLADCQAVIRHKGHDKRCPANLCHFCGAAPEWKAHDDGSVGHAFIPRGPCSDACGHDRTTGEKA
jgi:hypothetical protein